jgi:hypothetical protein
MAVGHSVKTACLWSKIWENNYFLKNLPYRAGCRNKCFKEEVKRITVLIIALVFLTKAVILFFTPCLVGLKGHRRRQMKVNGQGPMSLKVHPVYGAIYQDGEFVQRGAVLGLSVDSSAVVTAPVSGWIRLSTPSESSPGLCVEIWQQPVEYAESASVSDSRS